MAQAAERLGTEKWTQQARRILSGWRCPTLGVCTGWLAPWPRIKRKQTISCKRLSCEHIKGFATFELREYGARPWLLRILHNAFFTAKGQQRRRPTLLDDVDFDNFEDEFADTDIDPATVDTINWEQMDQELKTAVENLQPEYRTVLLLWAIEGLSYKEIAAVCNCAVGTVMSRLYRARQLLWRALRAYARERKLDTRRFDP